MTLQFHIDKNDFLTYQLYIASQSERIIKKRRRNKFILPLVYFGISALWLYSSKTYASIVLIFLGLLWFLLYPLWEKRVYFKHYQNYVNDILKDRLGKQLTLSLTEDFILAKDEGSESKIQLQRLKERGCFF